MYTLVHTKEKGRGLVATKDIKAGTLLFINDVIITAKDAIPDYNFVYNKENDCICLGHGEIFNHSNNANVTYEVIESTLFPIMMFVVSKDVLAGEELCIDYRQDSPDINLKEIYGI